MSSLDSLSVFPVTASVIWLSVRHTAHERARPRCRAVRVIEASTLSAPRVGPEQGRPEQRALRSASEEADPVGESGLPCVTLSRHPACSSGLPTPSSSFLIQSGLERQDPSREAASTHGETHPHHTWDLGRPVGHLSLSGPSGAGSHQEGWGPGLGARQMAEGSLAGRRAPCSLCSALCSPLGGSSATCLQGQRDTSDSWLGVHVGLQWGSLSP